MANSELLKGAGKAFEFCRLIINRLLERGHDADQQIHDVLGEKRAQTIDDIASLICEESKIVMRSEIDSYELEAYRGELIAVKTGSHRITLGEQVVARTVGQVSSGTVGWIVRLSVIKREEEEPADFVLGVTFRGHPSDCGHEFSVHHYQVDFALCSKGQMVRPKADKVVPYGQMFPEVTRNKEYKITRVFHSKGTWLVELEGVTGEYEASKFFTY